MLMVFSRIAGADVNLTIQKVEHDRGNIEVWIYTDAEAWLDESRAIEYLIIPAKVGRLEVTLSKIKTGAFAAFVYHDENGDGERNTGLFWRPKEGFAFSNNYEPKGPPQFSKAAIQTSNNEKVIINLNY